jgi:ribosomal-protein-alanine N-acetyltransferase
VAEAEPAVVTPADASAIAALAAVSFAEPWSAKEVCEELAHPDAEGWVLWRDRIPPRLLGYALGRRVLDELHLMHVAVDPSRRRHGAGSALLRCALDRARETGVNSVLLEVRASNSAARAFYLRHGFVAVGRRPRYYAGGEDAVLMSRWLRP